MNSVMFVFLDVLNFYSLLFTFQDPNPALRLKDEIIAETGQGTGKLESSGPLKRRESPDFDDNIDPAELEDERSVGGGLRRDISLGNEQNGIITTQSVSNEVDWKVNIFCIFSLATSAQFIFNPFMICLI